MIIFLGIGTNLGDREANLRTALQLLHERVGECIACSSIYRSAPQGFVSENEFANVVVVCRTDHSPEEVLLITQQIEREMGRTEKSVNGVYHDRVIDIDLLQAGIRSRESGIQTLVECKTDTLTLPHPRMHERDFVLIPLREVEAILQSLTYNL
ncbi:MAG: 2-amino-4-hydroxy-6-hydroxymethyldihydropteridine diphosphokinase [Paludibacteraceae bacterium]|nr:2-amino-4-hydroxy-6-hydroxymethyldihydropteridine diphosphokinase [Paludibacteraceae bacterium]